MTTGTPGDDDLDAEVVDRDRAAALNEMAANVIADLDDARASEQDAIEACTERQMADLEREISDRLRAGTSDRKHEG